MFKMLIGISFVTIFSELIITDGSFKKYIRGIVGIFAFIIIIEGILSFKIPDIDNTLLDEALRISELTTNESKNKIIDVYEGNIKKELENNNIEVLNISVKCDESMTIKSIELDLKDKNKKNDAILILSEKFGLDESLVIGVLSEPASKS